MATVSNWNFFNSNVQSGLLEGRYMNAAFTMLAAGPPRLSAVGTSVDSPNEGLNNIAWPIGVLQSVNLGINSQWMRLWEIGSERSYFIRGRTVGQLSLGRIMYHGPNLLRSLYAYLDVDSNRGNGQLYENSASAKLNTNKTGTNSKNSFKVAPGYQNIWLELASDVFSQPVGLLLYMKDSNEDTVAAFYIEYCNVANFGWSTDAGGTVMSENASIMYERIVPIEMSGVPVIADSTSIENIVGGDVIGSAASPV